jgi:zinc protease
VVLVQRHQRVGNNPASKLSEMITSSSYLHHPYGTPIIGWEHELKGLTPADARAFHERWYAPNNAVLIIAGDVTAADVRPLAEKHYGPIPRGEVPRRERVQEPAHSAPRRVELESAQVGQPQVSIQYLAPSYRTDTDETAYALEVLSEVLGGGPTSRLYRRLVVEEAIAASAGSWYSPERWDKTNFGFYISPRPGIGIDEAEAALRAEIEALLEDGVSAEAVEDAKQRLRADAVYARDSVFNAPRIFGRALTTGQTVADVEAWPSRIAAVTPARVEAAAREVLQAERSVTSILKSKPTS